MQTPDQIIQSATVAQTAIFWLLLLLLAVLVLGGIVHFFCRREDKEHSAYLNREQSESERKLWEARKGAIRKGIVARKRS